jgi:2-hydroxy-3-oxopropionate reductase
MILNGNFKPGFRIELHIKDLLNALDTARELEVPLSLTSQVLEIMKSLQSKGKGKDDHSSIIRYYEERAGTEVRKK